MMKLLTTRWLTLLTPYGDGKASERTVVAIAELLGVGSRIEEFDSKLRSRRHDARNQHLVQLKDQFNFR